jgi:colanic acid/amylovoran biosynthesis glycosyltransferase
MSDLKPISVVFVGMAWPPETFLYRLVKGLTEAGVQVTVACETMSAQDRADTPGLSWLPVKTWQGDAIRRMARLAYLFFRALLLAPKQVRVINNHLYSWSQASSRLSTWNRLLPFLGRRWDVIYFPWSAAAYSHYPLFALGTPVIVSCRGTQIAISPHNPLRKHYRDSLGRIFESAAAVHCVSRAISRVAASYGVRPEKARIIHPAVDTTTFCPAQHTNRQDAPFYVVTTGTLIWTKGLEYGLQSILQLIQRGVKVHYRIIGDGPEVQRVLYTIRDLELQDVVSLHGRLAPKEVVKVLQESDVFLLASLSEGISNAALEAMACGLPVVTTDCGGMREAVTDRVEGFVVPVRDPEKMASALATLASDARLCHTMGAAGRERVLKDFRFDQQVSEWVKLLSEVVGGQERSQ